MSIGLVAASSSLSAQSGSHSAQVQPLCVSGCLPPYKVVVTPDGGFLLTRPPFTSGVGIHAYSATFTVDNDGTNADTYEMSCHGTGSMICDSISPGSLSLASHYSGSATAYYHVGPAGSGQLVGLASGEAGDTGYYNITVAAPANAPVVSTDPHDGSDISVGACVAACFHGTWAHTTPAYFTMGQAHATTLAYNSGSAAPTATIALDVSSNSGYTPTAYGFQAKLRSSGVALTFLNGATSVYYAASDTQRTRVILALDPRVNSLPTGAYDVLVTATSYFPGDSTSTNTIETYLLVVDLGGSPYGKGVDVAGVQRAYIATDGSVLVTEGDGSAAFYRNDGELQIPGGTTATLYANGDGTYTRAYLDGSWVKFNSAGREIYAKGKYNDSTTFSYSDTLLTRITDKKFGRLMFKYSSGHLTQLYDSLTGSTPRRTNVTITSGKLVTIQDPDTLSTTFTYDSKYRVTAITDRAGQVSNVYYDTLGFVDSTKGPSFTKYPSGSSRQVIRLSDAVTGAWQVGTAGTSSGAPKGAVEADTLRWRITDPAGATTSYTLDRFGQALTATNVLGATDTWWRDTLGRVTMYSPAGHNVTTYTWYGYLLHETSVYDGPVTYYAYNTNMEMTQDSGSAEVHDYTYGTTLVHKLSTESAGGVTLATHYFNSLGQDTAVVDADTDRVRWRYDGLGNLDTTYDARGTRTVIARDQYGRDTSVTAPLSGTTYTFYDKLNRVIKTRNPYGQEVTSTFDSLSRLVRLKDAKGQVYKFAYSPVGVSAQYDLGDTTKADTYGYDATGRLIKAFTRRGDTLTMAYDTLSRLISRTGTGAGFPAESLAYDTVGRRTVVWNTNATDTMTYNALGQLSRQSQRLNGQTWTFTYGYADDGRLIERANTVGYGSGGYNYLSYTIPVSLGPMTSMTDGGVTSNIGYTGDRFQNSTTYNPASSPWSFSQKYNKDHTDSTHTFSPTALNNALGGSFQYDSLDRLVNQAYGGPFNQRQFKYDSLGRLANYCDYALTPFNCENEFGKLLGDTIVAYTYDSAGNRLVSGDSLSWVGAGNRIRRTRNWYYTYDASGNVLTKCTSSTGCASGYKYTWNAVGELTTVKNQSDAVLASYAYDALGRRIQKIAGADTLRFVYDGDQVILDLNANNSPRTEYGYQPGGGDIPYSIKQDSNSAGHWTGVVVADPMVGTVLGIANYSGGGLIKQYAVDPWGRPTAADTGVKTRLGLAGQEYDAETGLYHMGERYYDPDAGRFLSEDPIGISGGTNRYVYASNNPVLNRDPSGTDDICYYHYTIWEDTQTGEVVDTTYEFLGCLEDPAIAGGNPAVGGDPKDGGGAGAGTPGVIPGQPPADTGSSYAQDCMGYNTGDLGGACPFTPAQNLAIGSWLVHAMFGGGCSVANSAVLAGAGGLVHWVLKAAGNALVGGEEGAAGGPPGVAVGIGTAVVASGAQIAVCEAQSHGWIPQL